MTDPVREQQLRVMDPHGNIYAADSVGDVIELVRFMLEDESWEPGFSIEIEDYGEERA